MFKNYFFLAYLILRVYTGTCVSHRKHRRKRERFGTNAGEWTGGVEISKEEIPSSKRSVWIYTDLLQALKGERLSSVFSPDGTLISASATPHCGGTAVAAITALQI